MTTSDVLIRLFEDPAGRAQCRGCAADIVWHETLTGRKMPMNAGAVPRKSERHAATGRVVGFYAAEDAHWNSCPEKAQFSRR